MFIPVFNVVKFVEENGFLTSSMQIFMDTLNQSMQNALSDNGWTTPQITAANLTLVNGIMPNGTFWYEKDAHVIVFKINGSLYKVSVTPYP